MPYDAKGTVNKVILIGRLGQDPEVKYTASGTAVLNVSIATNSSYKGQDGNLVENTEWNRIVAWRRLAEVIGQYAKKGSRIYVEGRLVTRSWEDQNGNKRYTTEVIADGMQFLDSARSSDSGQSSSAYEPPPPSDDNVAEPSPEEGDDLPF
jgi:single-strand DNA-binding protein